MLQKNIKLDGKEYQLIPMSVEHVTEEYIGWLNDPEVNKFLEVRRQKQTRNAAVRYVSEFYQQEEKYLWGIFPKSKPMIGTINLHTVDRFNCACELGLMIGNKSYWGTSASKESMMLVVEFAFKHLGLNRVAGGTHSTNVGMNFTYKTLGFALEGKMREAVYDGNKMIDGWRWGLLATEWKKLG